MGSLVPERPSSVARVAPQGVEGDGVEPAAPVGGLRGRVDPAGWVAAATFVAAVVFHVVGTRFLIGNYSLWHWVVLVGIVAASSSFTLMDGLRRGIEKISDICGSIAWKLAWVIFVVQLVNVVTRYSKSWSEQDILFGETTSIAWMSFGFLFLIGVSYGVKAGVNPRIDFWWAEFSDKKKAWLDFTLHTLLFLPFLWMGTRLLLGYAGTSLGQRRDGSWPSGWQVWETWEQSGDADQLPVGPIQAFILVGFVLWALQIVAEIIKTGFIIIGRNDLGALEVADAPLRVE